MNRRSVRRPSISNVKLKIASIERMKRREWLGATEAVASLGLVAKDMGADAASIEIKPNGKWSFQANARGVVVLEAKGYSGPLPQFSTLPEELRQRVFRKWGRECFYCGSTTGPMQVDHKVPVAKGGTDEFENLVPACRACNLSKGAKLLDEWRPVPADPASPPPGEPLKQGET